MPQSRATFEENIDILFEELMLAIQWGRPSILLAIHKSKPSQIKAEEVLKSRLERLGHTVSSLEVNSKFPDIARQIVKKGKTDKSVYFISNIDRGGGIDGRNAYRALNVYRELFVENQIKAVLWLTISEASNLPKYAPDFWAFRHRVVEFASPHTPKTTNLPVGIMLWHNQDSGRSPEKAREKILIRKRQLAELPDRSESLSLRLELIYELGYLYWVVGDLTKAAESFRAGVALGRPAALSGIRAQLLNGTAITAFEEGDCREAAEIYGKLIESNQRDGITRINLSAALRALGKSYEAFSESKKAVSTDPTNGRIWNSLGHLYISVGKFDEAAGCFKKAIELAPRAAVFYESMAACYSRMGLPGESLTQIIKAQELSGDRAFYRRVYEQAILGNREKSLSLLRDMVEAGQVSKMEIRRDPSLNALLGDSLIQTLFELAAH